MTALNIPAPVILDYNVSAAAKVIEHVTRGEYCTVLGPYSSGKTSLLRYAKVRLSKNPALRCLYVSLCETDTATQAAFFTSLARMIARLVTTDEPGCTISPPADEIGSSGDFRAFIGETISWLGRDLVLIIDDLERVPTDLLRALLNALRAISMEQSNADFREAGQLVVVVAGALSLAGLTIGEKTSPFYGIAKAVQLGDLTDTESRKLITDLLDADGVMVSSTVREQLLDKTRGNAHLIRLICRRCREAARHTTSQRLSIRKVRYVINRFVHEEAADYPPLQEALGLLEEEPDLLHCVLRLLQSPSVPRRELPLPLMSDPDPLYLTGIVRKCADDSYQLHNDIYREFLKRHFNPERVSHLLTTAGRWDEAIDHLEKSVRDGDKSNRDALLDVTIMAIYTTDDYTRASSLIARALSAVFGAQQITLWLLSDDKRFLQRILPSESMHNDMAQRMIAVTDDQLETQALREPYPIRTQENGRTYRAASLWVLEDRPLGVLTMIDDDSADTQTAGRGDDTRVQRYLRRVARALQELIIRQARAEILREISKIFSGVLTTDQVLALTLDHLAQVIPFDTASIQLLNRSKNALEIKDCRGFDGPEWIGALTFPVKENGYPNVRVWRTRTPQRYATVRDVFNHLSDPKYQMERVQGWLGIPLVIADEAIGVITLDSYVADIYTLEHENIAMLIAGMAAVAIQRARLYDRQQQEKDLIGAAAQMTGSLQDLKQTWHRILDGAMELTGAEAGNISQVDEARGSIIDQAQKGFPPTMESVRPIGTGSVGWVATNRKSVLIYDVQNEPEWSGIYLPGWDDTRSELAVPIIHGDSRKIVGTINLESPRPAAFTLDDLRLLEELAIIADLALNNALHYQELERTKDELLASQAVAWLGLFGADWQHTINQKIFSIQGYADGLQQLLAEHNSSSETAALLQQAIAKIVEVATSIRSIPFASQVPANIPGASALSTCIDEELPKIVNRWCARRSDVEVRWSLDCAGVSVDIHPQWLRVAMEKLINNALKAMPTGGTLMIATELRREMVAVTIYDSGHGIPRHAQPFFLKKNVPRTTPNSGSGMGALIARFIALNHSGDLQLMATGKNCGTELLLTLPITSPSTTDSQPQQIQEVNR